MKCSFEGCDNEAVAYAVGMRGKDHPVCYSQYHMLSVGYQVGAVKDGSFHLKLFKPVDYVSLNIEVKK